jgi:hypothetical protein
VIAAVKDAARRDLDVLIFGIAKHHGAAQAETALGAAHKARRGTITVCDDKLRDRGIALRLRSAYRGLWACIRPGMGAGFDVFMSGWIWRYSD